MMQYARIYGIQAVLAVVLALLVVGIALLAVRFRTSAGDERRHAMRMTIVIAVMVLGAALTFLFALTPAISAVASDGVEWNPMDGFMNGSPLAGSHMLGNILMLSWVGLCVPALWRRLSWIQVVGIVAATSLLVEVAQFAFIFGRVAATQDLILNVAGGAIAAVIGVKFLRPWVGESVGHGAGDVLEVLVKLD